MNEHDYALRDTAMAEFVDSYFKARPQLMRTRHEECMVEAGFKAAWKPDQTERAEKAEAELARLREQLFGPDGWEANARYVLDRCKHTVRLCEGGGPENLCGSLILTFTKMEDMLAGKSPAPVPEQSEGKLAVAVPAVAAVECLAHETECRTCKNDISKCVGAFKPELALPADLLQSAPQSEVRHD